MLYLKFNCKIENNKLIITKSDKKLKRKSHKIKNPCI